MRKTLKKMIYKQLPNQITLIDTGLMGNQIAACYLLESDNEVAIVETGNYNTTPRILSLLEQKQINREQVRYVIPTHVHLDHAGGSCSLINSLPEAQLVIHPQGARHMIDPSKLIAGATAVYGESTFKDYYGEITPVKEERIIIAEDNDELTFGSRTLLFRDTPGHAKHHFCVWDEQSKGWFTGDTFGIGYPLLSEGITPFVFPSTTPVQFNPTALLKSIEMLMSYQPKYMYLTHFGMIKVNREISQQLCQQINDYVDMVKSLPQNEVSVDNLKSLLKNHTFQILRDVGSNTAMEAFVKTIAHDLELNSQGLKVWYDRFVVPTL